MNINIDLGNRSYPIYIGADTSGNFPAFYKDQYKNRKCAIVTNNTIASIYSSYINTLKTELGCPVHTMPDGEKYKTINTWSAILDDLLAFRLDRKSVVVALGGGVVGDMAGFAAACFMRGIDYIQIPTTLLAMVDSSVGGKTAVDHPLGKNLIGAFHQPTAVWIDTDFLKTLPRRQYVAGYAEAFKYAFIGGGEMFAYMMNNKDALLRAEPEPLLESIRRGVRIKADIVSRDEKEAGVRALLNFGHTFAHALESYYGFEGLLHGEAVLWGMLCAVELAKVSGALPPQHWDALDRVMDGLPLPPLPSPPEVSAVYAAMFADKKTELGELRFILPILPGMSEVRGGVRERDILGTLEKVLHV
ncbi:MAG: 3-dehydroquinate synthase [Chitinispirillales bacterium]|jgi:3-dehydroquinate synthase|nr:3-dehydroquinate synthase [Chitinispirillales bacterium]